MIADAGNWFLTSGIQNSDGGVARYRRFAAGNLPVSTEITGYTVSALCWFYQITGEKKYLDGAELSSKFLLEEAWHPEYSLFPFEVASPLPDSYFFDCGIIIRGLLALWRINKQQLLLDVATACAYGMRQFQAEDGSWHPIISLPHFKPRPHSAKWSREPGCFQLKAALAWLEVGELTNDPVLLTWFDKALQQALESDSIFLVGSNDDVEQMNRLHAYCYFLEALLKRPDHGKTLALGLEKASRLLGHLAPKFERSDVCAQLLRVQVLASQLGIAQLDSLAARASAERLAAYQLSSGGKELEGGFGFGRSVGAIMPMVNPVSTAFGAQALGMFHCYQAGGDPGPLTDLI